jgi:hypothetical protein
MRRPDGSGHRLDEDELRELDALDRVLAGAPPAGEAERRLAGLAVAVRDDRPPLRPAFAAELDERVAAGFPRRRAARPRAAVRRLGPHPWLSGLGVVATLGVVVAVVAGTGPTHRPGPTADGKAQTVGPSAPSSAEAPRAAAPGGATSSSSAAGTATSAAPAILVPPPAPSPSPPVSTGGTRAVQRDATLGLVAPRAQVQQVTDRAIAAVDRLGGIVESSQVALDDQGGSQASLELQVPSAGLDRTLAALSSLAHVSSRTQGALDITDATGAARDRLTQARAERRALLRQLARATTANELASIRAQLALVGGRIASDQAQLRSLLTRAQFAHLSVTIAEGQQSAGGGGSGWGPGAALDDALRVLEAVFAVVVVALAGLVPVAVLGSLAWWGARPLRRRRREAALSP